MQLYVWQILQGLKVAGYEQDIQFANLRQLVKNVSTRFQMIMVKAIHTFSINFT